MIDESLWRELEAGDHDTGLSWRRIHPESEQDLRLAFDATSNTRRLVYARSWAQDQAQLVPESTKSIGVTGRRDVAGTESITVTLLDSSLADIFNVLVADVASAVAEAEGPAEGIVALNSRLGRWQQLLARVREGGLTPAEQRGLFGELHVLNELLVPALGASGGLQCWTGPLAANQDFQGENWAIEVKSTIAKQPQGFIVNNERELDGTGVDELLLLHTSLDERRGGTGQTLNDLIDELRDRFAGIADLNLFNRLLISAGYFEEHREKYDATSYTVRLQTYFEVRDGFPRIVESDLLPGVGDTEYKVDLVACDPFKIDLAELMGRLFPSSSTS